MSLPEGRRTALEVDLTIICGSTGDLSSRREEEPTAMVHCRRSLKNSQNSRRFEAEFTQIDSKFDSEFRAISQSEGVFDVRGPAPGTDHDDIET